MSDLKNTGVSISLDIDREMVFSLNVLDSCIKKYNGMMDEILNSSTQDFETVCWLSVQMLNEGAVIHNDLQPDNKIPMIDEVKLKRYTIGLGGILDLQKKAQQALLKGLPEDAVIQITEPEEDDSRVKADAEWGDDEPQYAEGTKQDINFARLIYIGKTILGYSEREVWRMTLRKLLQLFDEHCRFNGIKNNGSDSDDVIPEDVY
jgi:hypothetical protein